MSTNATSRSTELRRRSPWEDFAMAPWSHRMRELMEDVFQGLPSGVDFAPGGELQETDEAFTVELDLPGVDKKDINIDLSDRRLTVRGERVVREKEGVLRHTNRVTGTFSYEALLPCPIDEAKVTAALTDGVLTITMPKASEAKSTHITVK